MLCGSHVSLVRTQAARFDVFLCFRIHGIEFHPHTTRISTNSLTSLWHLYRGDIRYFLFIMGVLHAVRGAHMMTQGCCLFTKATALYEPKVFFLRHVGRVRLPIYFGAIWPVEGYPAGLNPI